jgi:hypothetical protein
MEDSNKWEHNKQVGPGIIREAVQKTRDSTHQALLDAQKELVKYQQILKSVTKK